MNDCRCSVGNGGRRSHLRVIGRTPLRKRMNFWTICHVGENIDHGLNDDALDDDVLFWLDLVDADDVKTWTLELKKLVGRGMHWPYALVGRICCQDSLISKPMQIRKYIVANTTMESIDDEN